MDRSEAEAPGVFPPALARIVALVMGVTLFAANHEAPPAGTYLGYFVPDSGAKVVYDLVRLVIDFSCAWLIYRGITGRWSEKRRSAATI